MRNRGSFQQWRTSRGSLALQDARGRDVVGQAAILSNIAGFRAGGEQLVAAEQAAAADAPEKPDHRGRSAAVARGARARRRGGGRR